MGNESFAKLYETEKYGQVLATLEPGDEGPEVRVKFKPESLGVCSTALTFPDDNKGWENAENFFKNIDEDKTVLLIRPVYEKFVNCFHQ